MSLTCASSPDSSNLRGSERGICRSKLLQGISRIKPQMMKKVLSSIYEQNTHLSGDEPSETSGSLRLMELFPQHKCDVESGRHSKPLVHSPDERSDPGFPQQEKPKLSQLTIFYNGEVNIYNVQQQEAQEIMEFAGSNLNREPKIRRGIDQDLPSAGNEIEKNASLFVGLGQVRQQSLQRFLERRKNRLNRLNSLSPYSRTKTLQPDTTGVEGLKLSLVL